MKFCEAAESRLTLPKQLTFLSRLKKQLTIVNGNVTNYNYETVVAGNHTLVYNFWTISGYNARFTLGSILFLYSDIKC